jgi:hypothetical protein
MLDQDQRAAGASVISWRPSSRRERYHDAGTSRDT